MAKRTSSPSNVELLGLDGLAGLLAVVLTLAAAFHSQDKRFRQNIYERCVARSIYDQAAQDGRRALVAWHQEQIRLENENRFVDAELREARIRASERVITEVERAIAASVPGSCETYR